MRIALASDFYPPFMGGVELQVEALARELAGRGHQVTVVSVHHAGIPERESSGEIDIFRLKGLLTRLPVGSSSRRYHPPFPDPLIVRRMRRLLNERQVEIVQAHGWIAHSVRRAINGTAAEMVLSVRDYGYSCAVRTLLRNGQEICDGPGLSKCLRCSAREYGVAKGAVAVAGVLSQRPALARSSAAIHVVSRYVGHIVTRDLTSGREAVLPVVIPDLVLRDSAEAPRRDSSQGSLPDGPFILFVGALQPHKGVLILLGAYRRLERPPPLVLIGTRWPDSPRRLPKGVTVIADVPHSFVMDAWQRALFGVVPSRWPDPLPGVAREAMVSGRTVVASATGGLLDIVDAERNGLLVPPDDEEALAAAMQRLIDDVPLRERLETTAADDARRLSANSIIDQFEQMYASSSAWAAVRFVGVPRRLVVIGGSGSGKTTIAHALGRQLSLKVVELDDVATDLATRDAAIASLAAGDAWIAEGIHTGWTAPLLDRADAVLWLDGIGIRSALVRVVRRFVRGGVDETKERRGTERWFRPLSYARHTAELVRAIGEIVAYHAGWRGAGESRRATAAFLDSYGAKVVRIETAEAARAMVAHLGDAHARAGQDDAAAVQR